MQNLTKICKILSRRGSFRDNNLPYSILSCETLPLGLFKYGISSTKSFIEYTRDTAIYVVKINLLVNLLLTRLIWQNNFDKRLETKNRNINLILIPNLEKCC